MFVDVYQRVRTVAVGEELRCEKEMPQNPSNPYAVLVEKNGITVGHVATTQDFKDSFIIFNERWKIFVC